MANVRDSDTSLWLHNKLGTSNDSWTGGSICSQLNAEVLRNIKDCFPDLQTQVKLKLLLSFFHIPRRNLEEWRAELEEILEVAQMDSEQWVSMLAELMKTIPTTGTFNDEITDNEENRRIFTDLVSDLRKMVRKNVDLGMLPLECHYLNKSALVSVVGQQPIAAKHFTLKRKPKSAALRAELLQKSADAMSNMKKSTAPTVPVRSRGMPRKMTDTTPLKGIPSRVLTGGFRSPALTSTLARPSLSRTPAGRKDGGIKLLDITEQPLGYAQAKKRKRMQAAMELRQMLADKRRAANLEPRFPLLPYPEPGQSSDPTNPRPHLSYSFDHNMYCRYEMEEAKRVSEAAQATPTAGATPDYAAGLTPLANATPTHTPSYTPIATAPGTTTTPLQAVPALAEPNTSAIAPVTPMPTLVPAPTVVQTIVQTRPVQQQTIVAKIPAPTTKPSLSLTREHMLEAQDMFRTSNKVTRPEKALILGFMAGSRENPCPRLGNIVTIKLSENQENVKQADDTYLTMLVETHFQMNYNTGEWKRIQKFRELDDSQLAAQAATVVTPAPAPVGPAT